ncbi:uncharacterized protein A4U43_C04F11000 [Asparagus officinalis]|uniref:Uncharacterized protein n=1 Tax=Asparagus officinalis TaxID=4686 RepID=A0A5P1EZX6_ASPOF|nr:uncharacterized protein A4U43_C04F11000 [Asparagus officinalis]
MSDRSVAVTVAAEDKLDEWESTGCRTPTSLCRDFNATGEEPELEFAECKTPTEPCCRISEPMTCPPAPMVSSPRHDFTSKLSIFPLNFEEDVSAAVDRPLIAEGYLLVYGTREKMHFCSYVRLILHSIDLSANPRSNGRASAFSALRIDTWMQQQQDNDVRGSSGFVNFDDDDDDEIIL